MEFEYMILIITILLMLICFLADKYVEQKQNNHFLKKKYELLLKIKFHKAMISKRHLHLVRYDFQLFNLNEALFEQDFQDFEKNTYFY
jgi:hypothetical protein